MQLRHVAQVLSLAALLAACGAQQKQDEAAGCPVTRSATIAGAIHIALPGSGKILALRRAEAPPPGDHLVTEFIDADGTITIKFPWWTGPAANGPLRVSGVSLDGHPGRVRGDYRREPRDFHPGYLAFPSEGCWRVTGRAGASSLSFVIEVVDCVRRECTRV